MSKEIIPTLERNQAGVLRQLAALHKMSEQELKEKWRDLYGAEPPCFKATFLKKRLAYRIQELFYGGLSHDARNRLLKLASKDPLANMARRDKPAYNTETKGEISPGTRLLREWNGRQYEVVAKENGFELEGVFFNSLSAVATRITGVKWNGPVFFGLRKKRKHGGESGFRE